MSTVMVRVHLVNGDLQEFREGGDFLRRLARLEREGLQGRALIHELITDDWGAPPVRVVLSGTDLAGAAFTRSIPYT
jgi:hypothetical protein